MPITVEFTEDELGETLAKLANEIEYYDDAASLSLVSAFLKAYRAAEPAGCYITALATKWHAKLRNQTD